LLHIFFINNHSNWAGKKNSLHLEWIGDPAFGLIELALGDAGSGKVYDGQGRAHHDVHNVGLDVEGVLGASRKTC